MMKGVEGKLIFCSIEMFTGEICDLKLESVGKRFRNIFVDDLCACLSYISRSRT